MSAPCRRERAAPKSASGPRGFARFAYPVSDPNEAADLVARLRKQWHDATHIALAWNIGSGDTAARRSSDAGEPSGTAGKALSPRRLNGRDLRRSRRGRALFRRNEARNGRLSRAHREAAGRALAAAGTRIIRETSLVVVMCPYDRMGAVRRLVRPPQVTLAGESFEASPTVRLEVVRSRLPALRAALEEARLSYEIPGMPCHPEERSDEGSTPRRRKT